MAALVDLPINCAASSTAAPKIPQILVSLLLVVYSVRGSELIFFSSNIVLQSAVIVMVVLYI